MSFIISKINNNSAIVYINNILFPYSKNIINKVLNNDCGYYPDLNNKSVLVLYIKLRNIDKLLKVSDKEILQKINEEYYENILGFLKLELYDKHIEIYDVCVYEQHKKKGIMKSIFKDVINKAPKEYNYFWLGVKFDNQMRDIVIKFYYSLGFEFQQVKIYDKFPVITMIFNRYQNPHYSLKSTNIQIYNGLNDISCSVNFYLKWDVARYINNEFSEKVDSEYGGIMEISSIDNKNFILNPNKLVKGDNRGVNTPLSFINWHTHPLICYKNDLCYIGWPSGQDMKYMFDNYYHNGLIMHYLFASEGVYILRLSKDAMKFIHVISNRQDWIYAIIELINIRFSYLEDFRNIKTDIERLNCLKNNKDLRCLTYPSRKQKENIDIFLERANTFILRQYVVDLKNINFQMFEEIEVFDINKKTLDAIDYFENFTNTIANFPIFKVDYISSYNINGEYIKTSLDYIQAPTNSYCPYK